MARGPGPFALVSRGGQSDVESAPDDRLQRSDAHAWRVEPPFAGFADIGPQRARTQPRDPAPLGMLTVDDWPLPAILLAFACVAGVVGWFGVRMTHVARELAWRTGMGEAFVGALFVGASTSLSGITTSVTAAAGGHAELAVSNGLGGIAAQTTFLAVADVVHRRANLEHAAASAENLFMAAFLVTLLAIHGLALSVPELAIFSVHPATLVVICVYVLGVRLLAKTHEMPMWLPRRTSDTPREPKSRRRRSKDGALALWLRFGANAAVVGASGWALAELAIPLSDRVGLSHGIVGGVFTAVATSIPELVVAASSSESTAPVRPATEDDAIIERSVRKVVADWASEAPPVSSEIRAPRGWWRIAVAAAVFSGLAGGTLVLAQTPQVQGWIQGILGDAPPSSEPPASAPSTSAPARHPRRGGTPAGPRSPCRD